MNDENKINIPIVAGELTVKPNHELDEQAINWSKANILEESEQLKVIVANTLKTIPLGGE